ncbi:MAG TPA: deoxyguanosinetriphosphate triphosphohydrolase [Phycisphaerae bacterium]|nr:deoxyguanosinetriphosphate triphosphohydrolase [Phycisphaerae bacterium]
MLTRRDFEARELRELAPYAAKARETQGRVHPEPEHEYRTAYQRDRDRVVHSTAFRRLEYKTQVFLTHEGDFFRTRLTHTMEVAQIARTLARALNLNEDLTEAVALAHDLGHTPFGHSGEEALRELMADHGGFEHNRHGVRIIDYLEHPYPQFRGLNLTWEVREGIAKHATQYDHPAAEGFDDAPPPLEGQAVEIADSIAYDSHDLDDALAMGIISAGDLEHLAIFEQAAADFEKTLADLSPDQRIRRIAKLLIDLMVSDVIGGAEREIADAGVKGVADVRAARRRLVHLSPDLEAKARELEAFLMDRVYRNYRVARMTTKAKRFITKIFEAYQTNPDQLRPDYRRRADTEGLERVIADYIAGMTDRFAQDEYQRLYEPFERV